MDTADQFVKEIFSWIIQGKNCVNKLKKLAKRLELEREGTNFQIVEVSAPKVALPLHGASTASLGTPASDFQLSSLDTPSTTADDGACVSTSKIKEHLPLTKMNETKDILNSTNKIVTSIQELFKKMKDEKQNFNPDPEELHRLILADVLMALGRHGNLDMSNTDHLPEQLIEYLPELGFSDILRSVCVVLLTFNLETGSENVEIQARSRTSEASGGIKHAGVGAKTMFFPEDVKSWSDLIENNHMSEASQSLRSRAEEILEITRELWEQFSIIEKFLRKLFRIKYIIGKKNRNQCEKKELIELIIEKFTVPEVQQWLRNKAKSDVFFHLVNLAYFIKEKLYEEAAKKNEKNLWKRKEIELIFLAHGSIVDSMIRAKYLLPSMFIKDILLYSPWNCFLTATAAYTIATGSIQPDHRRFGCTKETRRSLYPCLCPTEKCPFSHVPCILPSEWNSMKEAKNDRIPNIMVSPVGKRRDPAFTDFIALEKHFGEPAANRYLIPYLASKIGKVPFFVVTLAISLVLCFSKFEATIHLAACLGKSPREAKMKEEYLMWQYAYTVDDTFMTVPEEMLKKRDCPLFNMFKAVFGDKSVVS